MAKSWNLSEQVLNWGLILAIALGVVLRITQLGVREFWYDEVLSLLLVSGQKVSYEMPGDSPVPLADYAALLNLPVETTLQDSINTAKQVILGLIGGEPHPPLFYLSQHVWLRLTGTGEAATRGLNSLLSIGAIAAAYGYGRSLLDHRTGLILAALLALNPFFIFHSLNFRMYSPLLVSSLLAGWAVVHLIFRSPQGRAVWVWTGLGVLAIAAGLMTSYLFVLWIVAAGVVVLLLKQSVWRYGLAALVAVGLTSPWMVWGLPQQLNNADLDRFSLEARGLRALAIHSRGVLTTLGAQLAWGDWANQLPELVLWVTGIGVLLGLIVGLWWLARQGDQPRLITVAGLGLLPLGLALGADIVLVKSTLPWGLGRSVIFALPGLLAGIALPIRYLPQAKRQWAIALVLSFYAAVSWADVGMRSRQMFHQIAVEMPPGPSLLLLNSKAWGHVLRAAYYLPEASVDLLSVHPGDLATATTAALVNNPAYEHVVWLQAQRPLWQEIPPEQTDQIQAATEALLTTEFQPVSTRMLAGPMDLDAYVLRIYQRPVQP